MGVRDPLVDRCEDADERARSARATGPDLAPDVAGLFEADDPSPEGRRRQGTTALLARELGFPAFHVAHAGRNPLGRGADRADDPGLDRDPERGSFGGPTTLVLGELTEELAPYEVDGPPGTPFFLYDAGDDADDEPFGRRPAKSAFEAVGHNHAKEALVVRSQRDERTERESASEIRFEGGEPLRGPGDDRVERWKTAFPLGQEPVGVADRAKHRGKVRPPDPHIVQNEDGGAAVPPNPAEESGEDLGDGEPSAIEPLVQALHERGGHAMGPPQPRDPEHKEAGNGFGRGRPQAVRDVSCGPAGHGGGPGAARADDPDDPGRGRLRPRRVEAADDFVDLAPAAEGHGRQPVAGENFGTNRTEHELQYNWEL
jgi:hypothetical protein